MADNIQNLKQVSGKRKYNAKINKKFKTQKTRVKSGILGQTAKFGQRPRLIHIILIGIKN